MRTSTQNLILINRKPKPKLQQQIKSRGNWLIRGDKQKCLECHGVPRISLRGNGRLAGFYLVNISYPHKPECKNKG